MRKKVSASVDDGITFVEEGPHPVREPESRRFIPEVYETVEDVGPEKAKILLERNHPNNRNLSEATIESYAVDMAAGNWRPIGDPLRLDRQGRLIDGQHRLFAIAKSGVTVRFRIIHNLDDEDIHIIDTGKARRPADMLRISGFTNTILRGASLRVLMTIRTGPLTARTYPMKFTHSEIRDAAFRHPNLEHSLSVVKAVRGIRPSMLVAMHYIGSQYLGKAREAEAFIDVIKTGKPAYDNDPAHLMREKLVIQRNTKTSRMTEMHAIRLGIYVWNNFAAHRPLETLRVPEAVSVEGLDISLL